MTFRITAALSLVLTSFAVPVSAQGTNIADDVKQGHHLAVRICAYCHVAARDQPIRPILRPAAPSFESIAQRKNMSAEFVKTFLTTTHRDIGAPKGMPNPELVDFQIQQVAAYLLSLKKP